LGEAGAFGLNCAAPSPAQTTAQSTEAEATRARCIAVSLYGNRCRAWSIPACSTFAT
jgi:hypothetical protein